jgi:hypothetical protein
VAQRAQGDALVAAMRQRIDAAGGTGARAAARDVALVMALGAPSNAALQSFVLENSPQGGARPDAGLMIHLSAAVERRAVGEAALLATLAAAEGPARLDAASLTQILSALRAIGLEDDARAMAVEALLAGQPS